MIAMIRLLSRHRDLLYMLSRRDITVKYKQSIMGLLWAVLMPMLITSAGVVVKIAMSQMSGKGVVFHDILPVAIKAAPWAFFVASLRFSTQSLSNNYNLVTKIAFPRAVFPLSSVASQLFDFAIAASVIVVLIVLASVLSPTAQIPLTIQLLWVPVLIALLVAQAAGLALLLSSANLFFRDVKYLVEVVLTFAIFFTPVFYSVAQFGDRATILLINPVAPLLEGLDAVIVQGRAPDAFWTGYSAIWAGVLLLTTPAIFLKLEPKFAESV
jgi:ABC-type polysaccharide/polyol phosphate export permease